MNARAKENKWHFIEEWLGTSDLCHLQEIDSSWRFLPRKYCIISCALSWFLLSCWRQFRAPCAVDARRAVACVKIAIFFPFLWEIILKALDGSLISVRFTARNPKVWPLLIYSHSFVQIIQSEAENSFKKINSNRKEILRRRWSCSLVDGCLFSEAFTRQRWSFWLWKLSADKFCKLKCGNRRNR